MSLHYAANYMMLMCIGTYLKHLNQMATVGLPVACFFKVVDGFFASPLQWIAQM